MKQYNERCPHCGSTQVFTDADICLFPFPHVECSCCGIMIPLFQIKFLFAKIKNLFYNIYRA